jgi:hypothetical protein
MMDSVIRQEADDGVVLIIKMNYELGSENHRE